MTSLAIRTTLFAAATLAAAPLSGATAQGVSAASEADGRCMAALMMLSEKAKDEDKAALDSSMMFFMGKIVGRAGKEAVGPAVGAAAASVKEADAPAIAERCAAEIEAASDAM